MKILFIGDIVGRPGREAIVDVLPKLKKEEKFDIIIANGENLSHGKGITGKTMEEVRLAGIDVFTSGNHIWKQKEALALLDNHKINLIRPANYPPGVPGRGYLLFETGLLKKVLIINLIGRIFFKEQYDCPFRAVDKILEETKHERLSGIIVDFHAEATSEKRALGYYLAKRVSAVLGTHTHVPTADAQIIDDYTAYITDVGMVGLKESVIGVGKDSIIKTFLTQLPAKHEIGDGPTILSAVSLEIDDDTGRALSIKQIMIEST